MKRSIQITLLLFFVTGCGTPLQQPWTDFNAYFNTFYNAEKYYKEGLSLNERQVAEINPKIPISIYQSPTQAGRQEFAKAIEMGAKILRDYRGSRYVEPAIFLIGRSYFYRSEYFSSLEKFQELQLQSTGFKEQEAVFWQGRTYLEMETYNEGIRFLENELEVIKEWDPYIRAKTNVLLAQLHLEREDWQTGVELLNASIPDLQDRSIRSRSYFLYGQALENLGEYSRARDAYGSVHPAHQSYDLVFNAQRKEAEVSRRLGEFEQALEIYSAMERSDKNVHAKAELSYEIARTIQLQGDIEKAFTLYNEVLQNQLLQPTQLTRAKTYYGLAEIYRSDRKNYEMAAAYYDSAASQNVNQSTLPEYFNAWELASSFGSYARVKNEITEMDSLLILGRMETSEFNSVIAEIQAMQLEDLERDRSQRRQSRNTVVNIEVTQQSATEVSESNNYGFLNIENRRLLTDASKQFQAVWGDRPLADNWRRGSAVRGSRLSPVVMSGDDAVVEEHLEVSPPNQGIQLDLNAIPFTQNEQEEMRFRIENRQYQLANIFFLSLNMPDSAKVYYEKVTESMLNPQLVPRALYSLAEIELLEENVGKAKNWGERLLNEYPNTIFARRTADRLNLEFMETVDSVDVASTDFMQIESTPNPAEKAMELHKKAINEPVAERRPLMLFEAANLYMVAAKNQHVDSLRSISRWFEEIDLWEKKSREMMVRQDSAFMALTDTTLSDTEQKYWESIADSTLAEPDFNSLFPFKGAYWDSTRSVLDDIETRYSSSSVMPKVQILQESLKIPESDEVVDEKHYPDENINIDPGPDALPCSEMTVPVEIDEGMDQFLKTIHYPEWADGSGISGEISFLIDISPAGEVLTYEQVSNIDRSGIPQAFEQAIEANLRFVPLQMNESIQCVITFPYKPEFDL